MSTHPRTQHLAAGEQALRFAREFDAPVASVWRAHVDVSLFTQWMGPRGTSVEVERFDARTGGAFRYTVVGGKEGRWTFFGSYHLVTPERIVHTWQGEDGLRPTLENLTFSSLPNGRARLEGHSIFTSPEHARETLAWDLSGTGMDENFERLDELLGK